MFSILPNNFNKKYFAKNLAMSTKRYNFVTNKSKRTMKTITFYYQQNPVIILSKVAEILKLSNGYTIKTQAELMKIIAANCSYGLSLCSAKLSNPN